MATKKTDEENQLPVVDETAIALVKMKRPDGTPDTAEVHPDEVGNYALGGWVIAQ